MARLIGANSKSSPGCTTKHISALPDLCMGIIFAKLPLHDLLQAGRVCPLWNSYQMNITEKVRTVTVLAGNRDPFSLIAQSRFVIPRRDELRNDDGSLMFAPQLGSKWARIAFERLDMVTVNLLVDAFPNVDTLLIAIKAIPPSSTVPDYVAHLLYCWSRLLTTLKMWIKFSQENDLDKELGCNDVRIVAPMRKLIKSINALTSLDHLTLDVHQALHVMEEFSLEESYIFLDLPILFQLREFFIYTDDDIYCILSWLKVHCKSARCRLERIGVSSFDKRMWTNELKHSKMASKFVLFPRVDWLYVDDSQFRSDLFSQYSSLTTLYFDHRDTSLNFDKVIDNLALLKQLYFLHIDFNDNSDCDDDDYEDYNSKPLSYYDKLDLMAQLSSVKILSLKLQVKFHSRFQSRHWAWIFPNVQIVNVEHDCFGITDQYDYPDCSHYYPVSQTKSTLTQQQLFDGVRQLLRTFKQCPKLRRIYSNWPQPKQWDIEEI